MSGDGQAGSFKRGHPLSRAMRELMLAADEVDQSLIRRLELNPTDYAAMNHLMSGGQVGPVELGTRLGISSGSATALVDRLESAGHVERHRHPSDRRRLVLAPTAPTAQNIINVLRPMLEDLDALGEEFNDSEQRAVERYLRAAAQRLRTYAAGLEQRRSPRGGEREH